MARKKTSEAADMEFIFGKKGMKSKLHYGAKGLKGPPKKKKRKKKKKPK